MSKNKKTRLRNRINKTEQSNLKRLKEIGKKLQPKIKSAADKVSKFAKKNAPKVKSNIKKTTKNISKSVKKNAPKLKKQGLKIGKGALKNVGKVAKGTVTSVKGGALGLASIGAEKAINQVVDRGFKRFGNKGKDKDMSLKDWKAKRAQAIKSQGPKGLARIKQLPGLIKKGWQNRGKLNIKNPNIKRLNPASDENKRIRDKERIIKSDKSTRREKQVAKSQKSTIKRIRDGVKLSDVRANQEKKMRDAARKRNEQFKKTGKSTYEQRKADAKKRMQDAARKRNEAWKKKRAKK